MEDNDIAQSENIFTPEDFNIFELDKSYPKDTVTVYLDDGAAHEYRKLRAEADLVEGEPDQDFIDDFNARLEALREKIKKSERTFYLTGVDADKMKDAMTSSEAHFEDRKVNRKRADGSIVRELPQSAQVDFMRYVSAVTLAMHVEKIVDGAGREVVAPGPDALLLFLDKAPAYAVREVSQAVERLQVDARDFEAALDDGFFPKS